VHVLKGPAQQGVETATALVSGHLLP